MGAEPKTGHTYQLGPATHADCISTTFVQLVKKLLKLSETQKASQKLQQQIVHKAHEKLIEEFNVLIEWHSNKQAELAKWQDVKLEYLDKLKGTSKHFNAKREVNLENAKLHKKSLEVNAGMYVLTYFVSDLSYLWIQIMLLVIACILTTFASW